MDDRRRVRGSRAALGQAGMFRVANRSMSLRGGSIAKSGNGAGAAAESRAAAGAPVLEPGPGAVRAGIHVGHHHTCTHGPVAPLAPLTSAGPVVESGTSLPRQTESRLVENASTPAASFPDGRCTYLTRPLPVPPLRANIATMASRPSTSGGPKAPSSFDSMTDRRISRDDMFLKAPQTAMENKRISRDDIFVGTRKQPGWTRPALSVMPRVGPATSLDSSPARPSPTITIGSVSVPRFGRRGTVDSQMSGDIPIGMAIGSPTHIPSGLSTTWTPQQAPPAQEPAMRSEPPRQPPPEPTTVKRTKTGRRRLFSLFSRKTTPDEVKAVKVPEPPVVDFSGSMYTATAESMSSKTSPSRSATSAGGKGSARQPDRSPAIVRTNTEPFQQAPTDAQTRMPARGAPFEPDWRRRQKEIGVSGPMNLRAPPAASSTFAGKGLLLDVEIPSIKMERYSVMFGNLLDARRDSALLNRRQAAVEKLHAISDRVMAEQGLKEAPIAHPRRATSPQTIMESPIFPSRAFATFPTPPQSRPERLAAQAPMSPSRMRSNTSPANLPSPMQSTFGSDALPRGQAVAAPEPPSRAFPATSKVIYFEPGQSSLVLESPTSLDDDANLSPRPITQVQPLRPNLAEPQWQMITPPMSAAPSSTSSSSTGSSGAARKRSPSVASSVRTNITKPSLEIEESDHALKAAVEISIARQISVSRQQRNLLLPLHTGPGSVRQGAGGGSIGSASPHEGSASDSPVKLGRNERLIDSVASTPTLIQPPHTPDSELLNYRKSSRVVLEAA
ncbi:hypothetical protein RB597_002551 [Gaeumannomyces tritici]